jgi:hypothetical protein
MGVTELDPFLSYKARITVASNRRQVWDTDRGGSSRALSFIVAGTRIEVSTSIPVDDTPIVLTVDDPQKFAERCWDAGYSVRVSHEADAAPDLVQEAWLRWIGTPEVEVRAPRAYLATIVTRLPINHLQSARNKRETYVGQWLPEPWSLRWGSEWLRRR